MQINSSQNTKLEVTSLQKKKAEEASGLLTNLTRVFISKYEKFISGLRSEWRREFEVIQLQSREAIASLKAENLELRSQMRDMVAQHNQNCQLTLDNTVASITARLAELKDGKDGAPGDRGEKGEPGAQ